MENSKILIYDGSFNGFLTSIYKAFDEKLAVTDIQKNNIAQRGLFSDSKTVFTKMGNAKRVWNGIQRKSHSAIRNIYFAFLSETNGIEMLLYQYIRSLFVTENVNLHGSIDDTLFRINQLAESVAKEKKFLETFIRFEPSRDEIRFAKVKPDFDVLPLISRHYRFQYANRPWIIFDEKRNYGLYYNLKSVELISLDSERLFQNEIGETNIKSLIVRKLHTQPVRKSRNSYVREREAV